MSLVMVSSKRVQEAAEREIAKLERIRFETLLQGNKKVQDFARREYGRRINRWLNWSVFFPWMKKPTFSQVMKDIHEKSDPKDYRSTSKYERCFDQIVLSELKKKLEHLTELLDLANAVDNEGTLLLTVDDVRILKLAA